MLLVYEVVGFVCSIYLIFSVSSVLNRDTKQFGKKHLTDGDIDTCWNSDQGSPQWIVAELPQPTVLHEVHIQFQGGFAGRECWVEGKMGDGEGWIKLSDLYPTDTNGLQILKLDPIVTEKVSAVKIVFNNSTDFFGRVTVYSLKLVGQT